MKKTLLLTLVAVFIASFANAQIFSDDFQDENMDGWVTYTPTFQSYATNWHMSDYEGNFFLRASCYDGTNHATEQWVISPSFSTVDYTTVEIEFKNEKNHSPFQDLELYVSTDFAGDSASFGAATWTQITGLALATENQWVWVTTTADISAIAGAANAYIAFKYLSTNDAGGVWDFDDVVVTGTASISETKANSISVYPNPTADFITISNIDVENVKIANTTGQVVLVAESNKVDVKDLANGLYFITVEGADGAIKTGKFLKK